MKWTIVRRIAWTAAWTAWGCFGIALHRVLPRTVGEPVAKLDFQPEEEVRGFVDSAQLFVTIRALENGVPATRLWDPGAQHLVRTIPLGWKSSHAEDRIRVSGRHGLLFSPPPSDAYRDSAEVVDLTTGAKRRISSDLDHGTLRLRFHDERRWLVGTGRLRTDPDRSDDRPFDRVLVLDADTGLLVSALPAVGEELQAGRSCHFVDCWPGGDRIVVLRRESRNAAHERTSVEVWRIPMEKQPERVFPDLGVGPQAKVSTRGRLVQYDADRDPPLLDVFDLVRGEFVHSDPPREGRSPSAPARNTYDDRSPEFSPDGRFVVDRSRGMVLDVEENRTHFLSVPERPPTGGGLQQRMRQYLRSQDRSLGKADFQAGLIERRWNWHDHALVQFWNSRIAGRLAPFIPDDRVVSLVDLRTGALAYNYDQDSSGSFGNDDWRMFSQGANLWKLPPRAPWRWIISVQGAVAAPLVALHLLLYWRRRRRSLSTA